MNEKMKSALKEALEEIDKMPASEFFKSMYGFTPEEEHAYTKEHFKADLDSLEPFFEDGTIDFDPQSTAPEMSALFWNYMSNDEFYTEEDQNATFPTYYTELPEFGIRLVTIYGQGSIKIIEKFDYKNPEYICRNMTRFKRVAAWKREEAIKRLLKDKPNLLDEVQFSTVYCGEPVIDTGVIERVYTKKGVVRYLIDSVNCGKIIVFYNNDKYPHDTVTVTQYHPNNYDSY